jgi:hypothetical protein
MSLNLTFLESMLIAAIVCLIAAVAVPQPRARLTRYPLQDRSALEECRRTSESALRRMACAEQLARLRQTPAPLR